MRTMKILSKLKAEYDLFKGVCPLCKNTERARYCDVCQGAVFVYDGRPHVRKARIKSRYRKYTKRASA